jgi:2'-5' RNA ligase
MLTFRHYLTEAEDADRQPLSCIMAMLPASVTHDFLRIAARIPSSVLATDGREDKPHITVRYGTHTQNPDDVAELLYGTGVVTATLGAFSSFSNAESDSGDVLLVAVDSPDLEALHRKLGELPHTDTHPQYKPHATIAYLKPGMGQHLATELNKTRGLTLRGRRVFLNTLIFSTYDEERTPIYL